MNFVANREQEVGQLLDVWVLAELLGYCSGSWVDTGKISNGGERGGHGATVTFHEPECVVDKARKFLSRERRCLRGLPIEHLTEHIFPDAGDILGVSEHLVDRLALKVGGDSHSLMLRWFRYLRCRGRG